MAAANNKSSTSPVHAAAANNSPPGDANATMKDNNTAAAGGGKGDEEEEENGYEMGNDDAKRTRKPGDVWRMITGKLHNARNAVWNGEKKELIGRTWDSWAKIGLFYLIFYSCLALFFAIMMGGFYSTLDNRAPTQKGLYSLIKANPGMGFRPMPNIESTLIRFRQGEPSTYKNLIASIEEFLSVYKNRAPGLRGKNCSQLAENETLADPKNEFCEFDLSELGNECTPANNYGYEDNKPCVLLKINKVYGWQPRAFSQKELNDENNTLATDAKNKLGKRLNPNFIGITCEGENEGDADNLREIKYFPNYGFSFKHYPYFNQPNYLPPFIFVQFDTPREGALIQVWCRLWVSNIKHHKNDKAGSAHFELLVN